jgi:hypothetical protein
VSANAEIAKRKKGIRFITPMSALVRNLRLQCIAAPPGQVFADCLAIRAELFSGLPYAFFHQEKS